jgi:hypothetical protein
MLERRDKRGRRIGRNWWREYVTDLLYSADEAWFLQAEAVTIGYATELAEYRETHPRPQLRDFLVQLAGSAPLTRAAAA